MKCPACHVGILSREMKDQIFSYKRKSITVLQPGMWCDHCEEGVLSGKDLIITEKAFEEFKSVLDNLFSKN